MATKPGKFDNDPLYRAAQLGLDVEHFITHNRVGQYLVERAHQDRIEALEALAKADPHNAPEIYALQIKARTPDLFLQWLNEAVAKGVAAEETILAEEAADKF